MCFCNPKITRNSANQNYLCTEGINELETFVEKAIRTINVDITY